MIGGLNKLYSFLHSQQKENIDAISLIEYC